MRRPRTRRRLKLLTVPTEDGKLTPDLIDRQAYGWDDEHRAMPQVVSITQNTELGTVYTPDEVRAICEHAHERNMLVHLDGSRIANAAASLDVPMRAFTNAVGVDVLSLGGTKNGALFGEAVVVINPDAVRAMKHIRKMSMQLASKMRFISAQFEALLARDLWLRNARHANTMAKRLAAGVRAVDGVEILYRCRPTPSSRACRTMSPSACRSVTASTSGTRRPATSAGCAPSTRPWRTWTGWWTPCGRRWGGRPHAECRAWRMTTVVRQRVPVRQVVHCVGLPSTVC